MMMHSSSTRVSSPGRLAHGGQTQRAQPEPSQPPAPDGRQGNRPGGYGPFCAPLAVKIHVKSVIQKHAARVERAHARKTAAAVSQNSRGRPATSPPGNSTRRLANATPGSRPATRAVGGQRFDSSRQSKSENVTGWPVCGRCQFFRGRQTPLVQSGFGRNHDVMALLGSKFDADPTELAPGCSGLAGTRSRALCWDHAAEKMWPNCSLASLKPALTRRAQKLKVRQNSKPAMLTRICLILAIARGACRRRGEYCLV